MTDNYNHSKCLMPEPTLRRLPWYLSCVSLLKDAGVEHVSTTQLAKEVDVDAAQIAKDLSFLSVRGKTRIGYDTVQLERELTEFLGFKKEHSAVIIGVGNLGESLLRDSGLLQYGLHILAGFDVNPNIVGKEIADVKVHSIDNLSQVQSTLQAHIAIIATPVAAAQQVAQLAVNAGFKAIWNFTPIRLRLPDNIVLHDTSIYAHLALIYNRLQHLQQAPVNQENEQK